jgi:glycosyltransferase 2 family protein
MKKNKIFKIVLKISVSLIFLYWVIVKTNWPEVLFYLKKIGYLEIILYIFLLLLGMLICAYRWKRLAEFKKFDLPLFDAFKLYIAGTFINNFMPSFIAGDAFKAYAIAKDNKRYTEAASTVMMDRITGLIAAMILALLFSLLNIKSLFENKLILVTDILILISLFSDVAVLYLKKIKRIRALFFRFMPQKVIDFFRELYKYNDKSGIISSSIRISFLFSFLGVAVLNYVIFWGLDIQIGIVNYLAIIFITTIISALPITINNIGLKEWSYITFFGLFGVNPAAVVAASVISRFLQMIVSLTAIPVYLRSKKNLV